MDKSYRFNALNTLIKDPDNLVRITTVSKVYICAYEVNTDGRYPFLKFLLKQNAISELVFPVLNIYYKKISSIVNDVSEYLLKLLSAVAFSSIDKNNILFEGFYEYNKDIYAFFNLTQLKLMINDIYSDTPLWFAIIDEIVNTQQLCDTKIAKFVTNFFTYNYDFCLLFDETNDNSYEMPIIGYVGKEDSSINFTYMFGVSKNNMGILGPYYYFTNYKNAFKQGGWSISNLPETKYDKLITDNEYGRYIKGGIVRFALFTSTTKYIENSSKNDIDISEIKTYIINNSQNEEEKENEILTSKISDYDGKWADTFDSCYLGNINLDNGNLIVNSPLIVLKEYDQQIPLSYHYINKKLLLEKYDETQTYLIV